MVSRLQRFTMFGILVAIAMITVNYLFMEEGRMESSGAKRSGKAGKLAQVTLSVDARPWATQKSLPSFFNEYRSQEEQWRFLLRLADTTTDYTATPLVASSLTWEGRNLTGMLFEHPKANKTVLLSGGIHGREWMTSHATLYAAAAIVLRKFDGQKVQNVINSTEPFNLAIINIINPDGYHFSRVFEIGFRKNRRPGRCVGVDINRNFETDETLGFSKDPCASTYRGHAPFSEIESQFVKGVVQALRPTVWIDIHSRGGHLLLPTSAKGRKKCVMETAARRALNEEGIIWATAAEVNTTATAVEDHWGSVQDVYGYVSSGNTRDWGYDSKNAQYAMTLEMGAVHRPREKFLIQNCRSAFIVLSRVISTLLEMQYSSCPE